MGGGGGGGGFLKNSCQNHSPYSSQLRSGEWAEGGGGRGGGGGRCGGDFQNKQEEFYFLILQLFALSYLFCP